MFLFTNIVALLGIFSVISARNVSRKLNSINGDITLAFIYDGYDNISENYQKNTLINSALWTTQRINFLDLLSPLKLGLSVYHTCSEMDFLDTTFELYKSETEFTFGVVTTKLISDKLKKFSEVLDIPTYSVQSEFEHLVKVSMKFLKTVERKTNITLATTNDGLIDNFYQQSRKNNVCIKECLIFQNASLINLNVTTGDTVIILATASDLNQIITDMHSDGKLENEDTLIVLVPLDGNPPNSLPEGTYVILPPYSYEQYSSTAINIVPTPLLFDVAIPLLKSALYLKNFIETYCNDTLYKVNCLRNKLDFKRNLQHLKYSDALKILKIEGLEQLFCYSIFRVVNDSGLINIYLRRYEKVLSYNIFDDNFTWIGDSFWFNKTGNDTAVDVCPSTFPVRRLDRDNLFKTNLVMFRSEAWIYALLSLSLLGVILCIAILFFLLSAIIRRTIFEGNPVLTILLLFTIVMLFTAVLPFSIQPTKSSIETLCTVKALSVTLSYTAVFSLVLSRAILLSSASKDVGFMSHIAGPVQAFMSLFIFGVQAALSIHVVGRCSDIFKTLEFIYMMSYNIVLLLLLLCLTPLIYKSQRNYREGKYFTIAVVLVAISWSVWLPCFVVLSNVWKEFAICLGLVTTGGIFLGAVFIPRTYLMTIAAERDKITSALPSLATATSAIDLYRAHTQPIYDCVNVTAINAAAIARAGVIPTIPVGGLQQPDLYSCPALPEDIDFNLRCDSPASTDKVTRF